MLLCRAYESSSRNEALMAADSCWMSARSSATVCRWKVSDVGSTIWGDRGNLAGSDAFDEGCNTNQKVRQALIDGARCTTHPSNCDKPLPTREKLVRPL